MSVCSNFSLSHFIGGASSGFGLNRSELLPLLSTLQLGGKLAEPAELYGPYSETGLEAEGHPGSSKQDAICKVLDSSLALWEDPQTGSFQYKTGVFTEAVMALSFY